MVSSFSSLMEVDMTVLTKRDARKIIEDAFLREVDVVMFKGDVSKANASRMGAAAVVGALVDVIEKDDQVADAISVLHPGNADFWMKTEAVASMLGYSRPYVTALLDSDEFAGKVKRSTGGQRTILRSEVESWMKSNGFKGPAVRPERNILNDSPPEFFDEPAPEEGRTAALARIAAERAESEKHRPARRRK